MPLELVGPKGSYLMLVIFCVTAALAGCGGGESESAVDKAPTTQTAAVVAPAAASVPILPNAAVASAATVTDLTPITSVPASEPLPAVVNAPVDATQSVPVALPSTGTGNAAGSGMPIIGAIAAAAATVTPNGGFSVPAPIYLRTVHVNAAASSSGDGTAATPYRTIGAALSNLRAGDDIVIAAGTYREWLVVPALPVHALPTRIAAATARSVVVKGSQEIGGWTAVSAGVYAVPWTGNEPEQVFRNGVGLQQIGGTVFDGYPFRPTADLAGLHSSEGGIWPARINGGIAELSADSFTYDAAKQRVIVKLATPLGSTERLEVSVRTHTLQAESANNLTIEGIDFAHSNTTLSRRWGAVKVAGKANTLRNLAVRDMDGTCVQIIGEDNSLVDSTIERCGQTGISGFGRRLTIANNQILSNNTRGFNKWWEAGGIKLIGYGNVHDSVIQNNVVAFNAGDGIWLDTMNTNILIENNTSAYNAGFGVHYEASQSGTIRGNRTYGNAMRGIYLYESSSTLIESNSVFGNAMEGIGVVDGGRSAANPAYKPYDNRVVNNTIAWNDFDRNWIQLVLPGDIFRNTSDNNTFKAEALPPRMSMGFMSPTNAPFWRLDLWQLGQQLDTASTTQTIPMPVDLKAALAARRLLSTEQLPRALAVPGSY